ncbi:MAG: VanW family protein [Minisyncoccia bacterium]
MKNFWKKVKIPLIILGSILVTLAITFGGFAYVYRDSVYPKVSVQGLDISSKNLKEAFTILDEKNKSLSNKNIILTYEDQEYTTTLEELGIKLNTDDTLVQAYRVKRNSNIIASISQTLQDTDINWIYTSDNEVLESVLGAKVNPALKTLVDAKLDYQDGEITIIPEQPGESLDTKTISANIAANLNKDEIKLAIPLNKELPSITTASWESQKQNLDAMIKEHTIFFNSTNINIPSEEIITWITIDQTSKKIDLSQDIIKEYLESVQKTLTSQPVNAKLRFNPETQQIEILEPGQEGTKLMMEESSKRIKNDMLAGIKKTELFVAVTSPLIDESQFDALGVKTLLGKGESNFRGSSKSRVKNINVAANKISSTLLKPGEEFSFVNTLGKVDARNGYLPELVIKGDKTIPEYGGGICQVSTTLFRAALNAGLPITERRNHSYVVNYYGKPGLDATIYLPKPDFKFQNDTNHHILIQHYIVGTILYYEIYGTSTGKTAKTIEPVVLESSPDGSMKTVAYREIYEGDVMIKRDTFYSTYRPPNKVTSNPLQ